MRTISATEASRRFSDLLDAIEAGETIRVTRGNRPIAEIRPALTHNGRELREALEGSAPPDEHFAESIAEAVGLLTMEGEDPWVGGVILDTNLLIAYERGDLDRTVLDHDDLAIAAITIAEYRTGIELADTPERAAERARALAIITGVVEVLDYTEATAVHHARLLAYVRRSGRPRSAHDMIVAAHAAQTGRQLLSRDAKARFGDLPGLTVVEP